MPINIDKLMRFPIPSVRQQLRPTDIALYALSVGLGRDPLDGDQLAYVDPLRGPAVMPSMVLVMAHPGFWLGHPDSGVDPRMVLHASQGFEIVDSLPTGGTVESRSRITEVIDKGEGKAALILTETELHDGTDRLFARLQRTTFIRGGGGFGGSAGSIQPKAEAPAGPPDITVTLPTAREQALLYRLNGDLNPLHSDPALAEKAGFAAPILHGLCTMGVVTHALLKGLAGYRAEALHSVRLSFSNPVYPGETIRTEIWRDGRFRALVVERDALVVTDGVADVTALAFAGAAQ